MEEAAREFEKEKPGIGAKEEEEKTEESGESKKKKIVAGGASVRTSSAPGANIGIKWIIIIIIIALVVGLLSTL